MVMHIYNFKYHVSRYTTHFIWLLRQHHYDKETIMMYEENRQQGNHYIQLFTYLLHVQTLLLKNAYRLPEVMKYVLEIRMYVLTFRGKTHFFLFNVPQCRGESIEFFSKKQCALISYQVIDFYGFLFQSFSEYTIFSMSEPFPYGVKNKKSKTFSEKWRPKIG